MKIIFFICLLQIMGCSTFSTLKSWVGFGDEKVNPNEVKQNPEKIKLTNVDSDEYVTKAYIQKLELKVVRLWNRIEELKRRSLSQEQKLKLLEKGLILGIIPEELKREIEGTKNIIPLENLSLNDKLPAHKSSKPLPEVNNVPEANKKKLVQKETPKPIEKKSFESYLSSAQQAFRGGDYGRAIAEYSALAPKDKAGSYKYWIGLSWYKLKEYQSANKYFNDLTHNNPDNAWVPRAKFYLAKSQYKLGFQNRALKTLKEIIEKYPNEDAAELAKMEIKRLENNL